MTYMMNIVVSFVFRVINFPQQRKIVTIDRLSYSHRDLAQYEPSIPMVNNSLKDLVNVDTVLYPSLMGTFNLPPQEVNMLSCVANNPSFVKVPFKTSCLSDPWNLPNLNNETSTGMVMHMSAT